MSHHQTKSDTVQVIDGPWEFECCDVRSAGGIALEATFPPVDQIVADPCSKHNMTQLWREAVAECPTHEELVDLIQEELNSCLQPDKEGDPLKRHEPPDKSMRFITSGMPINVE